MGQASRRRRQEERRQKIAALTIEELRPQGIICQRCGADVDHYDQDTCTAAMDERCEGFDRYDEVRRKHEKAIP